RRRRRPHQLARPTGTVHSVNRLIGKLPASGQTEKPKQFYIAFSILAASVRSGAVWSMLADRAEVASGVLFSRSQCSRERQLMRLADICLPKILRE
ncbi:MAG TPA: hypothetical protein VGR05_08820, partial [Sphingomicrobium sp.]|nr:hypothetical protein [Sphingomicrobium sp.]